MCNHSNSAELEAARQSAATANANATAALAAAAKAKADAEAGSVPGADNEQARKAAEARMRRLMGRGTAMNFLSPADGDPVLGYSSLSGA